ncbi:MAG: hypothetical protein ACLTSX_05475 [Collinsella sp.]
MWVAWLVPYVIGMLVGIPMHQARHNVPAVDREPRRRRHRRPRSYFVLPAFLGSHAILSRTVRRIHPVRRRTMKLLTVRKHTLLLIASIVWLAAGINIVRIGLEAYAARPPRP